MEARRKIIPLFIPHAGCPNRCVFCDQKRISGSLLPASGDMVRRALDALGEERGCELAFYGGSFTAIPICEQEELLGAAQPYRDNGTVTAIRVSTRPDAVDTERLERLRRYGVETVELGAQSMTGRVLTLSGRGHTVGDVVRASELVREGGFSLILQMMTGLPGETRESCLESAEKIAALRPDGVRIYPTVILRDTPLYEMWQRGEYREHTVEDAVELCADILPIFERAGIPVIRLGLNPTEELSGGVAVGGAYHPALGEMVRSRIYRRRAEEALRGVERGSVVTLEVDGRHISQMTGQNRANLRYLQEKFALGGIRVGKSPCPDGENFSVTVAMTGKIG